MKKNKMHNEEKIPAVETLEESKRKAMENANRIAVANLARQTKIIEQFMPAITSASSKLIDSSNATQGLSEVLQYVLNSLAQRMTLKEIGVIAELDKYIGGDPMKESKFIEQKSIVTKLEDWTVADVLFALQWYGLQSKSYIEKELKDVDLTKMLKGTKELLALQKEAQEKNEKLILSPIQQK